MWGSQPCRTKNMEVNCLLETNMEVNCVAWTNVENDKLDEGTIELKEMNDVTDNQLDDGISV